jgi:hypothetical protein
MDLQLRIFFINIFDLPRPKANNIYRYPVIFIDGGY